MNEQVVMVDTLNPMEFATVNRFAVKSLIPSYFVCKINKFLVAEDYVSMTLVLHTPTDPSVKQTLWKWSKSLEPQPMELFILDSEGNICITYKMKMSCTNFHMKLVVDDQSALLIIANFNGTLLNIS